MLKNKYILGLVLLLAAAALLFFSTQQGRDVLDDITGNDPSLYSVVRVSDGDTIVVDMNGTEEKIRFIGIDTPEVNHPDRGKQCYADEATVFLTDRLQDNKVRLVADPNNSNRDRYNRLLRYVYLADDSDINKEIIETGNGFAYTAFNHSRLEEFQLVEAVAQSSSVGLWSACEVVQEDGFISTQTISPFVAD